MGPAHSGGSAQAPGGSTCQGCLRWRGPAAGMCWTQGAPPSWCCKPLGLHTFPEASTREGSLGPAVLVTASLRFHFWEHLKELEAVWEGDRSEAVPSARWRMLAGAPRGHGRLHSSPGTAQAEAGWLEGGFCLWTLRQNWADQAWKQLQQPRPSSCVCSSAAVFAGGQAGPGSPVPSALKPTPCWSSCC